MPLKKHEYVIDQVPPRSCNAWDFKCEKVIITFWKKKKNNKKQKTKKKNKKKKKKKHAHSIHYDDKVK